MPHLSGSCAALSARGLGHPGSGGTRILIIAGLPPSIIQGRAPHQFCRECHRFPLGFHAHATNVRTMARRYWVNHGYWPAGLGAAASLVGTVPCCCFPNQLGEVRKPPTQLHTGFPPARTPGNRLDYWPNVRGEAPLPKLPHASTADTVCPPDHLDMTRAARRPPASICSTVSARIALFLDEPRDWELLCTPRRALADATSRPAGP